MSSKPDLARLQDTLTTLEQYVRSNDYRGYDPYDALNSPILKSLPGTYLKVLCTQIFVYSPVNFRGLFSVEPGRNPKALGLFLSAYCNLHRSGLLEWDEFDAISTTIVKYLRAGRSPGYVHYCWGFNFPWQDVTRYSEKNLPTVVNTAYIGNSLMDLFDVTGDRHYLEIAKSCCDFILTDLNRTEMQKGICFSYTPIDHHVVHNANMLGAAFLARVHSCTKEQELMESSKEAFNFSISEQKEDGSWAYSKNLFARNERMQIDFHQGFILDSIVDFIRYHERTDTTFSEALIKGADFYKNVQFDGNGQSKWRLPRAWPMDIHHQAQGILTFSKIFDHTGNTQYFEFANQIADCTITEMLNPGGYFNHQKWFGLSNKIPYMRWAQAWMMLALSKMLEVHVRE